jgi:hypothetical protein
MKNDKFLIGIIIGIVALAVLAVALVLARGRGETYVADDTPAGVARNYFLAVQRRDYQKAYDYLSNDLKNKPTLDDFISVVSNQYNGGNSEAALKVGNTTLTGDVATVDQTITTYTGGGPLESNRYASPNTAQLRRNAQGDWKLTGYPYPYWGYNWNEEKSSK